MVYPINNSTANTSVANFGNPMQGIMPPVPNGDISQYINQMNGAGATDIASFGDPMAKFGLQQADGVPQEGQGFFAKNFTNGDGSLNLGNIGQGIGMASNIFSTIMALKNFGMMEDAFKQESAMNRDNHGNSIAITQAQIDDRNRTRLLDGQQSNAAAAALGLPAPIEAPQLQNSLNKAAPGTNGGKGYGNARGRLQKVPT